VILLITKQEGTTCRIRTYLSSICRIFPGRCNGWYVFCICSLCFIHSPSDSYNTTHTYNYSRLSISPTRIFRILRN